MFVFRGQDWLLDNRKSFQIEVIEGNWGATKIEDVRHVFEIVAQVFFSYFDVSRLVSISVECRPHHITPEVHCRNSSIGDYVVSITAQDYRLWSYQFAHELCHILSGFENLHFSENKWFQESLCELASIFMIRQMAINVQEPSRHSDAFREYAKMLTNRADFQLPANLTLADWFKANALGLRADPYQRNINGIVALQLLPLVENNLKHWQSICFIPDSVGSFEEFLNEWQEKCPKPQKQFAKEIIELFGFDAKRKQMA